MSTREFGVLSDARRVTEVTISNARLRVKFLTLGARINGLAFDGIDGLTPELGIGDVEAVPYCGAIVGPVMNRLAGACAPLDGAVLEFEANEGVNLLHSGELGAHGMIWEVAEVSPSAVTFALDLPPDAFPGHRRIAVTYRLDGADLVLEIEGTTDAPTLMNVGFHPFWTLSGKGRDGHEMTIHAEHFLPMDGANIPTGEIMDVDASEMDYRRPRVPHEDVDHCFVLPDTPGMRPNVTLEGETIALQILSDAPAVHVFTGMEYGIAVEPEIHPDAPNHAHFPSIRLGATDVFRQTVVHRFSRL